MRNENQFPFKCKRLVMSESSPATCMFALPQFSDMPEIGGTRVYSAEIYDGCPHLFHFLGFHRYLTIQNNTLPPDQNARYLMFSIQIAIEELVPKPITFVTKNKTPFL